MPPAVTARGTAGERSADAVFVLAVDLGTGGPKVAVVSPTGRIAASASEPVALHLLPGGGAEQDPAAWWAAIVAAARRALELSAVSPASVVGVGCTAQWSGTVAVDESGAPLRPAVIWMDSRGSTAMKRQMRGPVSVMGYDVRKLQRWIRLTGGAPSHSGKDPTAHILWIRDTEPDRLPGHVQVPRARRLAEPAPHGAVLGVLRLHRRALGHRQPAHRRRRLRRRRCLRMSGLDRAKLPDLVPSATVMGTLRPEAAEELGLPAGVPVATGTGDVHSAAVGSGAVADFDGHLYIGTSSWISCHVPFKKTDVVRNVASIPAAIPGRYMVADEHETAGACLTFLAENVLFDRDDASSHAGDGNVYRYFDEVAGPDGSGVARGDVHAVAERRALSRRRPHHPGRVPQPVAVDDAPTTWCAPSTREWRSTADGCSRRWSASPGGASRRSPSSGAEPTPRCGARSTPMSWAGGSAPWPTPSWPTCGGRGS